MPARSAPIAGLAGTSPNCLGRETAVSIATADVGPAASQTSRAGISWPELEQPFGRSGRHEAYLSFTLGNSSAAPDPKRSFACSRCSCHRTHPIPERKLLLFG